MKKTKTFKLLIIICTVCLLFNSQICVNAVDESNDYIEYTDQIYFDDIDVAIADNANIILAVSSEANFIESIKAEAEIEAFNDFIDEHQETEETLIKQIESSELYAVGYTEAPLIYEDDHYERATSETAKSQTGTPQQCGYFTLTTSIGRTSTTNSAGEYLYTVQTIGEWTKNSFIGGSNYPASGEDFVVQTFTKDATLSQFQMITLYNDGEQGEAGIHSHPDNGGENFIKYVVQDDPLGLKQLSNFVLFAQYYGPAKNYSRTVHSVYTHTWATVDIDVEVSLNVDTNHGLGGGIAITPSVEEKSWNLFSNVTFLF